MKYDIRQRSTHMVTDATPYHAIDSDEFANCKPAYEEDSPRAFLSYLDSNFRDEATILANEKHLSKLTIDTLYSIFIAPQLMPLNTTKNIDEHSLLEISDNDPFLSIVNALPEGYSKTPKPKKGKLFIM